jgi:Mg2+/Co2+ transporter CorB
VTSNSATLLVVAVLLVLAAGLFAAADASLSAVSRARVEGLARAGRAGARQLLAVVTERPRHVNLLLLLRLACELVATVLFTVACLNLIKPAGLAMLVAGVGMIVVSYVLVGVGPRTIGRQHPYAVAGAGAGARAVEPAADRDR